MFDWVLNSPLESFELLERKQQDAFTNAQCEDVYLENFKEMLYHSNVVLFEFLVFS